MPNLDIDADLAAMEARYPLLFGAFRQCGWSESWRAAPSDVDREPFFHPGPFPMHDLARALLTRFQGLWCRTTRWQGVRFGNAAHFPTDSLKQLTPYEVEEYLLFERFVEADENPRDRPPAFPVATLNERMLFMRDDWMTVTVSCDWGTVTVTRDPFEMLDQAMNRNYEIFKDPTRHWRITNTLHVPSRYIGGIYRG